MGGFLQDFYAKKAPAASLAQQEPVGPPPPPGFEEYKNNAANGGVMSMIQQIITDAKAMEAEAIRSEEDAQKAYEDFVVETKEAKEGVLLELEQLSNYNAELQQSCNFVLKNFDLRQTARDEEVEALRQAKAILSGAKFEEFLQNSA